MLRLDFEPSENVTIVRKLLLSEKREKIPTTFVPMAPDKLIVEDNIDVLSGVFHIMWEDMPRRRTYLLKLEDLVSMEGAYLGSNLRCAGTPTKLL